MAMGACRTPFVGRQEEFRRLDETLERALQRAKASVPVAVIAGEAGVGKTRFVNEFISHPSCAATWVLFGSCIPLTRGGLPYAPIVRALRDLGQELAIEVMRELVGCAPRELHCGLPKSDRPDWDGNTLGSGPARARLFELVLDLLCRLEEDGLVLLVVEDAHWADRSTLDLLTFLMCNLQRAAVAFVITYRDDELHRRHPLRPWLAELRRRTWVTSLKLRRLNKPETNQQLTGLLGSQPAPALVDNIFAWTEGNAFLTEELASMMDGGSLQSLPTDLKDSLLIKVDALSDPARWLVNVAAVGGRRTSYELLRHVVGIPEAKLTSGLREVADHQILLCDDLERNSYRFRHALLKEAVYHDLLPAERRKLHAAFAQTLADHPELSLWERGMVDAELAQHWYASQNFPEALNAAMRAGRAAQENFCFPEALRQFERVLKLWHRVPHVQQLMGVDRTSVLEHAAEIAKRVGDYDRAVALVQEALTLVDSAVEPLRSGVLYERLGWYHMNRGDDKAASEAFGSALCLIPSEPPSAERASILAAVGRLSLLLARYQMAQDLCEEAIRLARTVGARSEEGQALRTLGLAMAYRGYFDVGIEHVREGLSIAQEIHDISDLAGGCIDLSQLLGVAGRLEESADVALQGCGTMRILGLEHQYGSMLEANAAAALFELGRWEQTSQLLIKAWQRGLHGTTAMAVLSESIRLAVSQGNFPHAQQQLKTAANVCHNAFCSSYHQKLLESRVELAIWQDRLEEASSAVAEGLRLFASSGKWRFTSRLIMLGLRVHADRAELARAQREGQEVAVAQRASRDLLERADELVTPPHYLAASFPQESAAIAATCKAEKSRLDGGSDPDLWAAAAKGWDDVGRPYWAAYALWRQAEACLETNGPRREADCVLRRAYQIAVRLGAQPLLNELELLARRAGSDLQIAAEPRKTDQRGLTPRELEVLQHIAAGRSNRQIANALFISVKTVSVHVSNILRKLEVRSRWMAARTAARLGLVDL